MRMPVMPNFLVRWEIDIEADDPTSAALEAANIVRDPESTASFFDVLTPEDESLIEQVDVFKVAGGWR